MPKTQLRLAVRSFTAPDETRPFVAKGHTDLVVAAGQPVMRATFEPGWRWSSHVKPLAETDSCEVAHIGYCMSGRMRVYMNDGEEVDFGAGDVFVIPAGHDSAVIGDEACEIVDFGEVAGYAKRL